MLLPVFVLLLLLRFVLPCALSSKDLIVLYTYIATLLLFEVFLFLWGPQNYGLRSMKGDVVSAGMQPAGHGCTPVA